MSKVLDIHTCVLKPTMYAIVRTVASKTWVIGSNVDNFGDAFDTVVTRVKHCPFCGEKLPMDKEKN